MSGARDLSTTCLGLRLANPFVVGASLLTDVLNGCRVRRGAFNLGTMHEELIGWMDARGYAMLSEGRGHLSLSNCPDPAAFERANYIRTLSSWP